jgi:thymidylate synthase
MSFNIFSNNVDGLVVQGIQHIKDAGERISVTAGTGLQAYSVNYVLQDSRQRVHNLRHPASLHYLCRELIAYFRGSLNVEDGLARASSNWRRHANKDGKINSNYGYYVFYQKVGNQTQYEWVVSNLRRNPQSRKALININQPVHKDNETKDFPCTIAAQFFVRNGCLCCEVSSRSADVVLGLPYDMGFFSFLNELVYQDIAATANGGGQLQLGYTMIKASFTQIYDKTAHKADKVLARHEAGQSPSILMPIIDDASQALYDIYNGSRQSRVIQWIYDNSRL